jgi:hypothetical protein
MLNDRSNGNQLAIDKIKLKKINESAKV